MQTKLNILKVIQDAQMSNYPNTLDWNTQNNTYRRHNSTQKRHHPYNHSNTPIQISIPATTPYQENVINNPAQALSPLSSADSTAIHESHESEISYLELFN